MIVWAVITLKAIEILSTILVSLASLMVFELYKEYDAQVVKKNTFLEFAIRRLLAKGLQIITLIPLYTLVVLACVLEFLDGIIQFIKSSFRQIIIITAHPREYYIRARQTIYDRMLHLQHQASQVQLQRAYAQLSKAKGCKIRPLQTRIQKLKKENAQWQSKKEARILWYAQRKNLKTAF